MRRLLWAVVGVLCLLAYILSPPFVTVFFFWLDDHWSFGDQSQYVLGIFYFPLRVWGDHYPNTIPTWLSSYNKVVFEGLARWLDLIP